MKPAVLFGALLTFFATLGCEKPDRQYEDYHLRTSADLSLTADNHPHGFRRSECFTCHLPYNIHQRDTLGDPLFDSARGLVEQYGLQSCAGCHGSNGVAP